MKFHGYYISPKLTIQHWAYSLAFFMSGGFLAFILFPPYANSTYHASADEICLWLLNIFLVADICFIGLILCVAFLFNLFAITPKPGLIKLPEKNERSTVLETCMGVFSSSVIAYLIIYASLHRN